MDDESGESMEPMEEVHSVMIGLIICLLVGLPPSYPLYRVVVGF